MLITLLSVTIFFSVAWSAGSHYLNIDAPGKAKIYFIHWLLDWHHLSSFLNE